MADNVPINASVDVAAPKVATDDDGTAHHQYTKSEWGPDNTFNKTDDASGKRFPVNVSESALIGALTESAPASDTASSGLNGRLQRIAQRITSLIALLPTALTGAGGLKVGSVESVITASVASGATLQATGSDIGGLRNWGIIVPSTFDGTQIQFQMSDTLSGTYVPVYSWDNQRVIMTVAVSRFYDIPGELMGIRFLKIETLTAQATSSTDFLVIGKS